MTGARWPQTMTRPNGDGSGVSKRRERQQIPAGKWRNQRLGARLDTGGRRFRVRAEGEGRVSEVDDAVQCTK